MRGCGGRNHLLIVGLHAEEDEVGRGTGQAALEVGAAPNLLRLCVEAVEGLHSLLKELPLDLEGERDREPGPGQPPWRWQWWARTSVGVGGTQGRPARLQERMERHTGSQETWGPVQTWPSASCVTLD